MLTPGANIPQQTEQRKSAASAVLRWMDDEITKASEDYIRALDDNLAICLCRSALEKTIKTGEKVAASVLFSVDGNRLNHLHLAVIHDPSDVDGRKNASENTVRASKFLNLEHKLIDNELIQYTVTPDSARLGAQSRQDRGNAARHLVTMIDEMQNG